MTGGSGFIGRNIVESNLADRYDLLAPGHKELELMDEGAVKAYLSSNRVDVVVHAAAKPGHRNANDPANLFYTNTRIFHNLARNHDDFERMIIIGSGAIYDSRYYRHKMPEDYFDAHVPLDEHGMSKYAIEKYIEHTDNIFDLRVFGIYGKYEDYAIRFISNMVCKALFDLPLTMNQDRLFDYLWVGDLVPILELVIERGLPWPAMNVTPDSEIALSKLASLVLEETGKLLPILIKTPGMGSEYSGDNARLRSILPSMRFTAPREGIRALIAYYEGMRDSIDRNSLLVDK